VIRTQAAVIRTVAAVIRIAGVSPGQLYHTRPYGGRFQVGKEERWKGKKLV
jgi:hypothetical protein